MSRSPLPQAESNAVIALYNSGRYSEAENRIQLLLKDYPEEGFLWKLLGVLFHMQGKDALPVLKKTALLFPGDAGVHNNLGNALQNLGRFADAAESYRRALQLKPDFAVAHNNLGLVLQAMGQLDAALASYRRVSEIDPDYVNVHGDMGNILRELGRREEALACYRLALKLEPDNPDIHNNLGNVLQECGELEAAVASYRTATRINPDFAYAHSNLGYALKKLGQFEEAAKSCRRAIELNPEFAEAYNNLGIALKEMAQSDAALASYCRAAELKPDLAEVYNNMGIALHDSGQIEAAVANYQRALEIKPDFVEAYSNLLYLHAFTRDIPAESERDFAAGWEKIALAENERIAAHRRSFDYPSRAGRKLRIGIVSAEIGQHAVAEFLEPILEHLDRNRFQIMLFPTVARLELRAMRLKDRADGFKSLTGIPDDKAAELIRDESIDILIDTTAHMRNCRLGIFAHRAAPVQCHYIGYHGTTGLTEMDWFIADEVLLPAFCDTHFREAIWRLPRLWIAYQGDTSLPESRWVPGLDGTVWLGSFNNLTKVREETLALWARVLQAIPESKLLLKDRQTVDPAIRERIIKELAGHGINAERIEFAGRVPDWRSHMALYDRLDIALDTIPLNSGTTAFDALWMGVPLVALEGDWMGARMTNAILKALGKPQWVARNEDEYVAKVVALAHDVEKRKQLRITQRALMAASPLCDAKGMTAALEEAFEQMFDRRMDRPPGRQQDYQQAPDTK